MQTSENYDQSIGKEPGKKVDPEQELRDAIAKTKAELEVQDRMAKEYDEARANWDEGSIPHWNYENYAGAESRAKGLREQLESYREELEDLLQA